MATLAGQAPPAIDRLELLRDLQVLSADQMAGREIGRPGGERARAYIVERFQAVGLEPVDGAFVHPFTTPERGGPGRRSGANVLGRLAGSRTPDRVLVISAHYDHLGIRGGQVFNGADDNASGTAALFAIARHFLGHPPRHSLIFAAFDGEEAGLIGAREFVRHPPVPLSAIHLNVNLDMIGRDENDILFVVGTRALPGLRPPIAEVAARAAVTLRMGHDDPSNGREDWTRDSDHYAFMEAGIPALLFSVEDEQHHHRPSDDYETMTHDFYVRAVETVIDVIAVLDGLAGPAGPGGRVGSGQ
jgi:Zn-dependent M28 family amino/carboxypeptidase